MDSLTQYTQTINGILETVARDEDESIRAAAGTVFRVHRDGGRIFVFGCTHSAMLSEEVFYRAGTLALFEPVFGPGLSVVTTRPLITSALERNEQIGRDIVATSRFTPEDTILVNSTSGKNAVPVEVALGCKRLGMPVIAITSKAYARFGGNHSSGCHLSTAGLDVVVDNHVPPGDCGTEVGGMPMAPVSTIIGAFVLHAISIRVVERMQEHGLTPPLLMSANVPGGHEHNQTILDQERVQAMYRLT